jgi:N-acetylglutamate synthase-like GNAT family acetyltransferase
MSHCIRPATEADQPAITAIVRAADLNPFSLDWSRFLVAEDDGRVVGVAQVKPHGDGSRELASLAVAPDQQGKGIGGALIQALLAANQGPLHLMCRDPLESYYIRFGFHTLRSAEMPPYFRRMTRVAGVFFAIAAYLGEKRHIIVMRREGAFLTA